MKMQCEQISNNHSNDKIKVFLGYALPWILCGYHASQLDNKLIQQLKNEGTK
jgi:hypothetical protein